MNFEIIKQNFDRGLWHETAVKIAVDKGVISKEQYKDITGNDYPNT